MAYTSISVEGGLFPVELLDRIARGESGVPGQRAENFNLKSTTRISDETQSAFSAARDYWKAFQSRLEHSKESHTTITREDWVLKFMELLDFNLVFQNVSLEAGGERYAVSHRAGDFDEAIPIHIAAIDQTLDHRNGGRRSPHAMVQEYLNRSDELWGVVTNGSRLRLLRNVVRISKPTYLEFDLEGMVAGNLYSEFVLLYRLLHASRFPTLGTDPHKCLIEEYYQQGIDEGGRVRDKLRDGVKNALEGLGNGFLSHPRSDALRDRLQKQTITETGFYRQLLRLVYRFLFLSAAEERHLLFPQQTLSPEKYNIYRRFYSVSQLRDRAERYFRGDTNFDGWLGLIKTFDILRDNHLAAQLGLAALNGKLFSRSNCQDLENSFCTNENLLSAIRELSTFRDEAGVRRRVNYAGLDVEEFGSVYESLLDYHPHVDLDTWTFSLVPGSERKQTGSYYTPPELVHELIESALVPVMADRLKGLKTKEDKEKALLGLRVCDPAAGSGHFLLAAARRIARELATVRSEEPEPTPEVYHKALRDVVRACIYAVDKNPLAVDLCKVALWIEGHCAGFPLGFLDHHIKCGDSLVGVFDLKALKDGIPDGAYEPVTGDDKTAARAYKKRNAAEKENVRQLTLGDVAGAAEAVDSLADEFQGLASLEELSPDDVTAKEQLYEQLRHGPTWERMKKACDLWTVAFFLPLESSNEFKQEGVPTTQTIRQCLATNSVNPQLQALAMALSHTHPFFHWQMEFPDVFHQGGFDAVLGNPPWERIKLQEKEFFAARDPDIAEATNKAAREKLIKELPKRNPALAQELEEAKHRSEAESKFIRYSGRCPLTARGDINTYSIFAETSRCLLSPRGRVGIIVPSGIATDDTTSDYFADLVDKQSLVSLYDFENREGIFPGVHRSYKFCLLTLCGTKVATEAVRFAFFLYRAEGLRDPDKVFTLTADDFRLLNPNTLTCPIFRTKRDAEITKGIYSRVPILINEKTGENPWAVSFTTMFHMSNDSSLFADSPLLGYVPLYEGKLIHQFDHRWATYDGDDTRDLADDEKTNPSLQVNPRYWIPKTEVEARLERRWDRGWFLGWRDITNATNERTVVACILPKTGVGNNLPLALLGRSSQQLGGHLCANLCSFVLDYSARFKVGGSHINFYIFNQLPVLPPRTYEANCPWFQGMTLSDWIAPRILELVYTAWDLNPFAKDQGYKGAPFRWDSQRRFLLRCELDAAFFHLYGITPEDVDYIMDTFPIVRRKDEDKHGEYRTKRVILEIYDEMERAMRTGQPYQTHLNPPPGDPRAAHQS